MATMAADWTTTGQREPRPRWLVNLGRGLAVLLGVTAGLAVLAIGGLYAGLMGCDGAMEDGTSTLCTSFPALVEPLDWTLVLAGCLAPVAGGIATCATRRPRWLVGGLLAAVVALTLVAALASGQASILS